MNRKRKVLLIPMLFAALLGAYITISMFNKTPIDFAKVAPNVTLESQALLDDFLNDENQANSKYLEQIVQVTGTISGLDSVKENGIVVLSEEGQIGTVICHLSPKENKKWTSLKKGQRVVIKGICTGFLMDVILVKCVLVNN